MRWNLVSVFEQLRPLATHEVRAVPTLRNFSTLPSMVWSGWFGEEQVTAEVVTA